MDAALDVAVACRWMHFCLAMIHGQPHLCASGDPEMCVSMFEQEQFFGLGDPRIGSHDDFVEVVLQGLPRGQGFRCEEAPRAEGSADGAETVILQQRGQLGHRLQPARQAGKA